MKNLILISLLILSIGATLSLENKRMLHSSVGSDYQIHPISNQNQTNAQIVRLHNGYIIVYQSSDNSKNGIYCQVLNQTQETTPVTQSGTPFRINNDQEGEQLNPQAIVMNDGGYVVVWESEHEGAFNIYLQRYSSSHAKIGDQVKVNTITFDNQINPAIASLDDGTFVVAWQSLVPGNGFDVKFQKFRLIDQTSSPEFVDFETLANSFTSGDQQNPRISALAQGFIIVWQSQNQENPSSSWDVYFQRFNQNGHKIGQETRANSITAQDQYQPDVKQLPNNKFIISWTGQDGSGNSDSNVYYQAFTSSGSPKFNEDIRVNTQSKYNQQSSAIVVLNDDSFTIVYESQQTSDVNSQGIFLQAYFKNFTTRGAETLLQDNANLQSRRPSVEKFQATQIIGSFQQLTSNWNIIVHVYNVCGGCSIPNCIDFSPDDDPTDFYCQCDQCSNNRYLSSGRTVCSLCPVIPQCSSHNSNGITQASCVCNSCNSGYFLNGGLCQACSSAQASNCANYTTVAGVCVCDACASGYTKNAANQCVSSAPACEGPESGNGRWEFWYQNWGTWYSIASQNSWCNPVCNIAGTFPSQICLPSFPDFSTFTKGTYPASRAHLRCFWKCSALF